MTTELDLTTLWTGLFGGLALFLFGMDMMTDALKTVAGDRMRDILAKLTKNRFVGVFTGAAVTAVIQSSSVTTVIMVGFISAGLVTMAQCVGVIMGANIGTTMTAQILAFKVTKAALPMITLGFLFAFAGKKEKVRAYGTMIMGLGLVFYGMTIMSDAMRPLRSYQPFLELMQEMSTPILGVMVGALFTALVQSSSATTGIVIVMAGQGLIQLDAAIALALGANVGTCATAGLAVIGKPREAVRAAFVHTLFNVVGVVIWLPFIDNLANLATYISPVAEGLTGAEKLAAESPRQIANAHTIFNIVNTALFIGFTSHMARLVERLIPDRPYAEDEKIRPRYLVDALLESPNLALSRTRLEISELGGLVEKMYWACMPKIMTGEKEDLKAIALMDQDIDDLHGHIIEYLGKINRLKLTDEQNEEAINLMEMANFFESIGDIIEKGLVVVGRRRISEGIRISEGTQIMLTKYHRQVGLALTAVSQAVNDRDEELAKQVRAMKEGMARLTANAARHEAARLVVDEPNRLQTYRREIEIIENLSQVFKLCRRIAKSLLRHSKVAGSGSVLEDLFEDEDEHPEVTVHGSMDAPDKKKSSSKTTNQIVNELDDLLLKGREHKTSVNE